MNIVLSGGDLGVHRLLDVEDDVHEVLWIRTRLNNLPIKYASIIIACIYHPPGSDNVSMNDYLIATLDNNFTTQPILWYYFNR